MPGSPTPFSDSVAQLNASGQVVSSAYTGGGLNSPNGIAIDGVGNVWVSNAHGNSITELSGSQSASPGTVMSPSAGYGVDAGLGASDELAIDSSGNVWVTNGSANALNAVPRLGCAGQDAIDRCCLCSLVLVVHQFEIVSYCIRLAAQAS